MVKDLKNVQKRLNRYLAKDFLATRPGGGSKLTYIEGQSAIQLANKIFGFEGWSTEIKEMTQVVMEEYERAGSVKYNAGYLCRTKITVKVKNNNGTVETVSKEDIGFGSGEGMASKIKAIESATKEAVTDSLKRVLRQLGNALGNCCYDKKFLNFLKKTDGQEMKEFGKLLTREEMNTWKDDEEGNSMMKSKQIEENKTNIEEPKSNRDNTFQETDIDFESLNV